MHGNDRNRTRASGPCEHGIRGRRRYRRRRRRPGRLGVPEGARGRRAIGGGSRCAPVDRGGRWIRPTGRPTDPDRSDGPRDRPARPAVRRGSHRPSGSDLADALERKPGANQLLWIDATARSRPTSPRASASGWARLARPRPHGLGRRPAIAVHGKHLHLRVLGEPGDASTEFGWIDIVIARNLIITLHPGKADVLDRFDERIKSDATVGATDGGLVPAVAARRGRDDVFRGGRSDRGRGRRARHPLARRPAGRGHPARNWSRSAARSPGFADCLSDHREVYAALADADVSEIADPDDEGFAAVAAGSRTRSTRSRTAATCCSGPSTSSCPACRSGPTTR